MCVCAHISVLKEPAPDVSVWKVFLPITVLSTALFTAVWLYRHRKPGYGHMDIAEVNTRD